MTPVELGLILLSAFLHAVWSVSIKGSRDPMSFNVLQLVAPTLAGCGKTPPVAMHASFHRSLRCETLLY